MERTTRTITTSGKQVVVMRDYVTGRELRQVQDVFFRGMEIKSATEVSGFKASAASEAQDVALGILLVITHPPHRNVFMLLNQQLTPISSRCRLVNNCGRDTS